MAGRGHRFSRSRGRTRRIRPGLLALSVVSVLVVTISIFAWQANRAAGALRDAEDRAIDLKRHIVEGDVEAARGSLASLDASTSRARRSTDGPLWRLGAHVPVLGRNVDAVRTAARELDHVADGALPGIVDVADKIRLEAFRPKDGRVDLEAIAEAAPALTTADEIITDADRNVGRFDAEGLIGPLREPMTTLQNRLRSSAKATSAADDAAHLLPSMLGADGKKRKFLMLTLNNAEVRSLGGIVGSAAVITTKDGKLTMGKQGSGSVIRPLSAPVLKLTDEEKYVFQSSTATNMLNTAIHPDFPRAAALASSIVGERWKQSYHGVIAVDPVAFSYLLKGLGPVKVDRNMTITNRNAVSTLLNGVYLKYPTDGAKQDAVFAAVARRALDAVTSGEGDSQAVVKALVRAVNEDRLMLWSRQDSDQQRIQNSGISGALSTGSDRPQVGVFLNDHAATKMEYYLNTGTTVRSTRCLDRGIQELRVTTALVSDAPQNARELPRSIVGPGRFVKPGNMNLGVMIVGPRGGKITAMTVDGRPSKTIGGSRLGGRHVAKAATELAPGEQVVIVTTMRTSEASTGDPELRTTPGARANDDRVENSSCS